MLNDSELHQLFERLQIPDAGRARIRQIRDNLPSRAVRSSKTSGKTRYAGIKMPFVVEAEANSTEYVAFVEWDHDLETLEYYPQPDPLKISYSTAGRTKKTTIFTTPDCLRITKLGIEFIECKREEELERLAKMMPSRYQRDASGRWRSPPAEDAAAQFGCTFHIRSSRENNWVLHENLELLKDYFIGEPANISPAVGEELKARLERNGWISTYTLIHQDPSIPADQLYALIAARQVFFPLTSARLSDQERALVFRDEITFRAREAVTPPHTFSSRGGDLVTQIEAGSLFNWDGAAWQVLNDGTERLTIKRLEANGISGALAELSRVDLLDLMRTGRITVHQPPVQTSDHPDRDELLRRASPAQLQEAVWKLEVIESRADPEKNPLAGRKRRAVMYWKRQHRDAELHYGNGFVGLLPRRSGNRKPRASAATLALAAEQITSDFETVRHKGRALCWGRYSALAKEQGLSPISYRHFCNLVNQHRGHRQTASRIGEKAAYDLEPQYLELEWTTPRHGVRPFHICHIDHTPLPLQFVHSKLGETVSTIWLSILIDAYSRKVLAYYLSFDPPSRRSCMMVIRDCVRRHNRVPQILVCDQGSDFMSVYFETLLASLRITKRERRAGKPKSGSVCERIFHTTQSQFIKVLLGSTDLVERYFRSISPEVSPSRHAVWTMDRFDEGFNRYLQEVYHQSHHAGLCMSPNASWAMGLRSHGERTHCAVPYSAAFISATCPAVHRGLAKVTPAGVKINYRWFKCPEFQQPGILGTKVEARYDPFNAGLAYAYVQGQWVTCHSEYYAVLSHYTERAVWLATERLRLEDREAGKQLPVTAERLAVFLHERELGEEIARQLRNDAEAAVHRQKIGSAQPLEQPASNSEVTQVSFSYTGQPPESTNARPTCAAKRSMRILEDL